SSNIGRDEEENASKCQGIIIIIAVALFDQNVVSCFYPVPSEGTRQVLTALPIAIGVVGSMLFVSFPTTRHGIGFPLSPR
ncbi:Os05g0562800, partial [Oryza sativa Japonica Group]